MNTHTPNRGPSGCIPWEEHQRALAELERLREGIRRHRQERTRPRDSDFEGFTYTYDEDLWALLDDQSPDSAGLRAPWEVNQGPIAEMKRRVYGREGLEAEVWRLREGIRRWLNADRSGDLPGQSEHYFRTLLDEENP